ncbi:MAG: DegT/DnrJ/EryC1/StrS family aminotransferase [bacterium]
MLPEAFHPPHRVSVPPAPSAASPWRFRRRAAARPLWKPMHMQPLYAGAEVYGGRVGEELFQEGLCLPSGSSLTEDQQDRVLEVVRSPAQS